MISVSSAMISLREHSTGDFVRLWRSADLRSRSLQEVLADLTTSETRLYRKMRDI